MIPPSFFKADSPDVFNLIVEEAVSIPCDNTPRSNRVLVLALRKYTAGGLSPALFRGITAVPVALLIRELAVKFFLTEMDR